MKKFGKALALLAAGALLFGSVLSSCSSGSDDDDDDVSVTGVTLDSTSLELKVGETATLTATVAPDDATNKKVSWSTGSGEIATVDGGNVTAVAKGSTTITVKTEDGEKTASCTVSVYEAQEYKFGESTVVVKYFGDAGTKATVNETEATVTVADGTMTIANSEGTTLYTATVKEDGTIDTSTVKDSNGNAVTVEEIVAITITAADGATSVEVDDTLQLTASVEGVTWSSSDDTKATVDETGLVTGVAAAESVTITASKEGNYTAGTITLAVKAAASSSEPKSVAYKAEEISSDELSGMSVTGTGTVKIATAGTYKIWGGEGSITTAANKMGLKIDNKKSIPVAIVSATNMTGATATSVPVVGANLSSIGGSGLVNYVKVNTPASGSTKISMNISTNSYDSSKYTLGEGLSFWILVTDTDGNILAVKDIGDITSAGTGTSYTEEDVEVGTADTGDEICIGFARGTGSGGLLIHSISLETTPAVATVSSIKVTTNPTKTNYALNETFESAGLVVTATYSDESTKALSAAKYTLSSPDMTTTGDKEVTVTYAEGIADKFTINVGTLESIAVTSEPTNKTYSASDTELNLEGLVVTATYSNTYTKDVTLSVTTSEFPAKSVGEQTITVSYIDGSVTEAKTASFKITVTSATQTGIKVTTIPTTTDYEKDSDINLTGLVVTAVLSDGSTGTSTTYSSESGITYVEGFDSSTAGENIKKTITVKYGEYTATFDYTYTVTEKETTYVLSDESATISLGKTNIEAKDYLSAATTDWDKSEKSIGDYTDTFYNMNGNSRSLTISVKNVLGFTVYVKNSTANRTFTVKIGDGDAETITHPGKIDDSDVVGFTFNTGSADETAIVLGGGSGSVYPGYIVLYNAAQTIAAESVTISGAPESAVVLADLSDDDKSVALAATVLPARATEKTVTWFSSDEKVATVTQDASDSTKATLTYIAAGTATITAKVSDSVYAEAEITLQEKNVAVTAISVYASGDESKTASGTLGTGNKLALETAIEPTDATNLSVKWTSSAENIATVSDAGVVTGVAAGTATITATAADGSGVTGTFEVTVKELTTIASVAYDGSSATASATIKGTNMQLKLENVTNKKSSVEGLTYNTSLTKGTEYAPSISKGFKIGSNDDYLSITLGSYDTENNFTASTDTFKAGDIVYITGYNSFGVSTDSSKLNSNSTLGTVSTGTGKSDYNVGTFTLPEKDSSGTAITYGNTLYLSRSTSSGTGFANVVVKRISE